MNDFLTIRRKRQSVAEILKPGSDLIEALVDAAMGVCHFDWDWDNESVPEVKYAREKLRNRFVDILQNSYKSREIQFEALEFACQTMTVHADDPAKAFSAIFKLKESLRPKPTPK